MAVNKFDEEITKSLDEIDALVDGFKKSQEQEETQEISKALGDKDLSPDDVSEDAPEVSDEDKEEGVAPEGTEESDPDVDEDEEYEKSLSDELGKNDNVKKALEVSEFLQELVKGLDAMVTDRTDKISKSIIDSSDESNSLLAKSVAGIARGQKAVLETNAELLKSVRNINARMQKLEAQPVVRKSVSNAQVVEKSFQASLGEKPEKTNQLTKSQASAKLMAEFEGGNQNVMQDILALDGTGNIESLSDEAKHILGLL